MNTDFAKSLGILPLSYIDIYIHIYIYCSAISSLNVCEKTFEKSRDTKPLPVTSTWPSFVY